MITVRKVRELHPVSRHVFPLPASGQSPATTDGVHRVCFKVSGNFEKGGRCVRVRSQRGESFTHARHVGWQRLSLTVPPLPSASADCVPVYCGWSTAGSVHYHLPSSLVLNGACDARRSTEALLPTQEKYWEKVVFFPCVMFT